MAAAFGLLFVVSALVLGGFDYFGLLGSLKSPDALKTVLKYQNDKVKNSVADFKVSPGSGVSSKQHKARLKALEGQLATFKGYLDDNASELPKSSDDDRAAFELLYSTTNKFKSAVNAELERADTKDSANIQKRDQLAQLSLLLNQYCLKHGVLGFSKVKTAENLLFQKPDSSSARKFEQAIDQFEQVLAQSDALSPEVKQDLGLQFEIYKQQAYSITFQDLEPGWGASDLYNELRHKQESLEYALENYLHLSNGGIAISGFKTNFSFLILLGLSLASSLGISVYYSKTITEPIRRLSRAVDGMVSNNFKQISQQPIGSEILEIEQLNKSVYIMANTIQDNLEMIARKNEDLANMYHETLDNINTARTIQHSLLPPISEVKRVLPESFVLNRPKDIVSGDFYWIDNNSDVLKIVVADCTGHGVAGAFMSFVGHSLLTRISEETPIFFDAASILDRLSDGVRQTLRQSDEGSYIQNGMDISLVCIDFYRGVLHFAGANQTLYLVRNGELNTIKSNKFSIGGPAHKENLAFTNHKLAYMPGDVVYLTSDGFADQIGGPTGDEKFKTSRLRSLFQNIHNLPMEEQGKVLSKVLEQWLGVNQLLDDVLVVGFKIPEN